MISTCIVPNVKVLTHLLSFILPLELKVNSGENILDWHDIVSS
jgi:hypothetical protein